MTTLEIILVSYIVLNWISTALVLSIPRERSKTLILLSLIVNPIVSVYFAIKGFFKGGV